MCHSCAPVVYADDIIIISRNTGELIKEFQNLEVAAKEIGLTANEEKTKFMEETDRPTNNRYLEINDNRFEKVTKFKYLRNLITQNNDIPAEISSRIVMANKYYYGLKLQLKSHLLSIKTKLYKP